MNTKLIIALAAILAISSVQAQVTALSSISERIASLSASATGARRSSLIQSAESVYNSISSEIAHRGSASASVTSTSGSVTSASMSASSMSSSAGSVLSSVQSAASSVAHTSSPNAGTALIGDGYSNLLVQFFAVSALFVASFVAMLA